MKEQTFQSSMRIEIAGKERNVLVHSVLVPLSLCLLFSCSSEKPSPTRTAEQAVPYPPSAGTERGPGSEKAVQPPPADQGTTGRGAAAVTKNNLPVVEKARLQPQTVRGVDVLKVVAEGKDKDGNKVAFRYEWTKNGEPAGEGDTLSGFKRGDRVSVRITPFDGKGYGSSRTLSTEIDNTTPRIVEHREVKFDGKVWTYQVKATDSDGDPLTYSLKSGPVGMTINSSTGLIQWNVPPDFRGKTSAGVSVSDGHGGEALYNFDVTVGSGK